VEHSYVRNLRETRREGERTETGVGQRGTEGVGVRERGDPGA